MTEGVEDQAPRLVSQVELMTCHHHQNQTGKTLPTVIYAIKNLVSYQTIGIIVECANDQFEISTQNHVVFSMDSLSHKEYDIHVI